MDTCPVCGAESGLQSVTGSVTVEVRGEAFNVGRSELHCQVCCEVMAGDVDPLNEAYRAYRANRGWKQPEEIRAWREGLKLTQKEVAKLLGWGLATVGRYETGALQSESHETALEGAMTPDGMRTLLDAKGKTALGEERLADLRRALSRKEVQSEPLVTVFQRRFGFYPADILSGMRRLSVPRLFGLMVSMCEGGERKTKLNKLCFYADFLCYARLGISLTGVRYARIPLGPVPNKFGLYLADLESEGHLTLEIVQTGPYEAEVYKSTNGFPGVDFSPAETEVINFVKRRFSGWSSTKIVEFSHKERAWIETPPGAMISYDHAKTLLIG